MADRAKFVVAPQVVAGGSTEVYPVPVGSWDISSLSQQSLSYRSETVSSIYLFIYSRI